MSIFRSFKWYLVAMICLTAATRAVVGRTVQVTSCPEDLLAALRDAAVATIELVGVCSLAHLKGTEHVSLTRNVTITGRSDQQMPVLDFAFQYEVISLCPHCWLNITGLAITQARRGTGDGLDAITGSEAPGAVLVLRNVVRQRIACTAAGDAAAVMGETQRSALLPQSSSGGQDVSLGSTTYQGIEYPNSLQVADIASDFPLTHVEGRVNHDSSGKQGHAGGFALWEKNVSRICLNTVSPECLLTKGAETCVNEFIDQAEKAAAAAASGPAAGNPAVIAVAVVVPLAVLAGLAVAAVVIVRKRRSRQQKQLLPSSASDASEKPGGHKRYSVSFSSSRPSGDDGLAPLGSRLCHADSATEAFINSKRVSIEVRITQQDVTSRPPLGGQMAGWEVAGLSSSPFLGPVQDVTVEFGELLGAGSFGRVYKARWAGQDVAVKVIEHNESTLSAVAAEAELLLSLNHPNLVRAYHYVTYTQESPQLAPSNSISSSQGSRMRALAEKEGGTPTTVAWNTTSDSAMDKDKANTLSSSRRSSSFEHSTAISQHSGGAAGGVAVGGVHVSSGAGSSRGSGGAAWQLDRATTCSSSWKPAKAETWLVQEYCDRGTLSSVAAAWSHMPEDEAQMLERLMLLLDAARGLAALHAECVVHGDLNARNVLVSSTPESCVGLTAKLADLGLSRVIKNNTTHRTTNTVGTMSHTAPELLRYGRMSPAIDIYSFGVMMWELYTNQVAFAKLHYGQFFETVVLQNLRPMIPAEMPADYTALLKQCWSAEPADRPTTQQLVQCLDLLIANRQAVLSGRAPDAAAMAGFWALLGQQPPVQDEPLPGHAADFRVGSPADVGSPVSSEISWKGFLQLDAAAAISDTLPTAAISDAITTRAARVSADQDVQPSSATAPAAGAYCSAQQSLQLQQDADEIPSVQLHCSVGDSMQQTWFV